MLNQIFKEQNYTPEWQSYPAFNLMTIKIVVISLQRITMKRKTFAFKLRMKLLYSTKISFLGRCQKYTKGHFCTN